VALTLDSYSRVDRTLAGPGGRAAGWLIPLAVVGLGLGLMRTWPRPRRDPLRAACLVWGGWLLAPAPPWVRVTGLAAALACCAAACVWSRHAMAATLAAVLAAPFLASVSIVLNHEGPFDTPFEPAAVAAISQADVAQAISTGGTTPSPMLTQLEADIRTGRIRLFLLVPADDPRVSWIESNCTRLPATGTAVYSYCGRPST
jgi:hypothetical protein